MPASPNDTVDSGDHVAIIHDLGNLIQIASSAVNIAARNPTLRDSTLIPVIEGARASLDRAGALVRQTVAIARRTPADRGPASLESIISDLVALIEITWDESVRLSVDIPPDLPALACDPLGLQNAILNLLLNARQSMPEGGVISINAVPIVLERGEAMELRIGDTGIGMTPETVDRAFDPFFTTKVDGLGGIGLPTVARFAKDAEGRVLIESEYGRGTVVKLQLPAHCPSRSLPREYER
jgi:signal transduction histidine kinase